MTTASTAPGIKRGATPLPRQTPSLRSLTICIFLGPYPSRTYGIEGIKVHAQEGAYVGMPVSCSRPPPSPWPSMGRRLDPHPLSTQREEAQPRHLGLSTGTCHCETNPRTWIDWCSVPAGETKHDARSRVVFSSVIATTRTSQDERRLSSHPRPLVMIFAIAPSPEQQCAYPGLRELD